MRKDTLGYVKKLSRVLRKNQTDAEYCLWQSLRGSKLGGYKFRRQYALGRYIVDFYCSIARLAVEIDGNIHDSKQQLEYDLIREDEIERRNIKVIRFSNEQVLWNSEDVLEKIIKEINESLRNMNL